jgi:hypothetical protein
MQMSGSKTPLFDKVAATPFLTALILTVAGMWLESPPFISMCAAGILLAYCL